MRPLLLAINFLTTLPLPGGEWSADLLVAAIRSEAASRDG